MVPVWLVGARGWADARQARPVLAVRAGRGEDPVGDTGGVDALSPEPVEVHRAGTGEGCLHESGEAVGWARRCDPRGVNDRRVVFGHRTCSAEGEPVTAGGWMSA